MAQINVLNLSFQYFGSSEKVFDNVSFSFDTNWKIGLIGRNGRGKTTLLNLLLGKFEFNGKIVGNVHFDYFPFEVRDKNKLAIDLLQEIDPEFQLWEIMKKMQDLDLDEDCLYQQFDLLSSGQQTKLLLAIFVFKRQQLFAY